MLNHTYLNKLNCNSNGMTNLGLITPPCKGRRLGDKTSSLFLIMHNHSLGGINMQDEVEYGPALPWHLITHDHVDDAVAAKRLEVCESCEFLINLTKQCSKCFCFMPLKVKLPHATCPENRWDDHSQ